MSDTALTLDITQTLSQRTPSPVGWANRIGEVSQPLVSRYPINHAMEIDE